MPATHETTTMMMSLNKPLLFLLTSAAGATGALSLDVGAAQTAPTPDAGVWLVQPEEPKAAAGPAEAAREAAVTDVRAAAVADAREVPVRPVAQEPVSTPAIATDAAPVASLRDDDTAFIGVILPERATDVVAPQGGLVEAVHVALGQVVASGERLVSLSVEQASLDHARAQAERAAARAALSRSRIEQEHAADQVRRSQQLAAEGLTTTDELSQARFKLHESRVLAAEAEAHLRERSARAQQLAAIAADARIAAPFAGRVATRYVDAGTRVAPGTPLLRLISDGEVVLRFAVPEQSRTLAVGTRVEVTPSEHPEQRFYAEVARVSPEIDAASRMRTVEAVPVDPAAVIEAGLVGAMASVRPLGAFARDGLAAVVQAGNL